MAVTIKNTSKKIRTFQLTAECECKTLKGETITQKRKETSKKGKDVVMDREVYLPPTVTFLPGQKIADLPDAVLAVPAVKRALADRSDGLRLVGQSSKKAKPPKKAPALTTEFSDE